VGQSRFLFGAFQTDKVLRNAYPGLGLEYRLKEDWSATAGRFTNSDNAPSNHIGANCHPWTVGGVKLGMVAGAFNGYP